MATVHPSRLGLVPANLAKVNRHSDETPDLPKPQNGHRDHDHGRSRRDRSRDERRRSRSRSKSADIIRRAYRDREHRPSMEERRERSPGRVEGRQNGSRRSPEYEDYQRSQRDSGAGNGAAPWRAGGNMYPPREGRHSQAQGSSDYFASRREQREQNTFSIWPPSPKERPKNFDPDGHLEARKRSKRHRSRSDSDDDSSEDERKRKRKKKHSKKKDSDSRKHHHRRSHRHKDETSDEEPRKTSRHRHKSRRSDETSDEESRERTARTRTRSRSRLSRAQSPAQTEEELWVEKPAEPRPLAVHQETAAGEAGSDEDVGPQPMNKPVASKKVDEREYGGALLRGEGSAMAAFLQEGGTNARIPRRGEIGLTSDEIASFESVGYVMSGSRHRRMNAVRMRKENQVISAEEKRGILKLQKEERERREAILRDEFKELVEERLKGAPTTGSRPDP